MTGFEHPIPDPTPLVWPAPLFLDASIEATDQVARPHRDLPLTTARLIDVHAGDMVEALEPFALHDAGPAEDRARELATAYGLGYVIRQAPGPGRAVGGSTSAAAAEAGIPGSRCSSPAPRP